MKKINKQELDRLNFTKPTQKAFTLAEVLITLVVIGIIAAITVPVLTTKYQKQQTVSKLKKAYSTLSQVVNRAQMENGSIEEWCENNKDSRDLFDVFFKPYLRNAKKTKANEIYNSVRPYKYQNGSSHTIDIGYTTSSRTSFILDDGTFVMIIFLDRSETELIYLSPFRVYLDINGGKGPNTFGRDVFLLDITRTKGIRADGSDSSDETIKKYCSVFSTNKYNGMQCLEKIMRDGWEIKEDYPW